MGKRTSYEAPHYAVFSSLPPRPNIHRSAMFSNNLTVCANIVQNWARTA